MAISAIVSGLGAIGITGTAATVGAVMLQSGIIGGVVNKVAGGDFGEGFLMGAITGGAEWAVSGVLGSIAPSLGQLGNAIASSAIVAGATAAALGQKNWLQQGLIGGAAAGIFYQAVDWAQSAFSKPSGAKAGSLVTDSKGNVFLIDSNGKGVHQPDMFAVADDATKAVTIVDKAGNVVNSTNQAAKPSQVYANTTANGELPPRVGLSQIGEIDGVAGTATYYTNGKATWTPINDDIGFGTSSMIDSGTVIQRDITLDAGGFAQPRIEYTTASGFSSEAPMQYSKVGRTSYNGQVGELTSYYFGDDVVTTFKPANSNSYIDVTDSFDNLNYINGKGDLFSDGRNTFKNYKNQYVDSNGMVYDAAGNPIAKLASSVDNVDIDWSGTLGDGYIQRTNGDVIAPDGTYLNGFKQGEFATDMTKSGSFEQSGSMNGKQGKIYKIDGDNYVFKPNDGSDIQGFQKSKVSMDSYGNIKEITPSKPVDLTPNVSPVPDGAPTPQPPKVQSQYSTSYDGQTGVLKQFDNGTYTFTDRFGATIDVPSNQVVKNAYGGVNGFDLPVSSIDLDGTALSANGTRLQQNYSGNYVDRGGIVYDDFGNPVASLKTVDPNIDYSGTLYNGKIVRPDNTVVDITTGAVSKSGYTLVNQADVPANLVNKPIVPDTTPTTVPDSYQVGSRGEIYDASGNKIGQLRSAATNPDVDFSGTLTKDGIITRSDGSAINTQGAVVRPAPDVTPPTPTTYPDSYQVGSRGEIYDASGNKIGQLRSAATNPDVDFSGTLTKDGIITRADGSAINTQGAIVRPATPDAIEDIINNYRPPVDTTPTAPVDTTPTTPDSAFIPPVDVIPPGSPAGIKMDAVDFIKLQNTQLYKAGGVDINAVNNFIDQGYTPDQIIRAIENNPNGGWANYSNGVRSMQPGVDMAPPSAPVAPVDTTPVPVDITPIAPVDITPTAPVDTTPVPVDITPVAPVDITPTAPVDETPTISYEPDEIEDIINNYRPPVDATPTAPVDATPTAPVDATPTAPVDATPTAPVDTTPVAPVDTTPVAPVDTTPVAPPDQGTPFTPPKPQPDVVMPPPDTTPSGPGYNYVDSSGTLYDQYGNPVKDLSGNYVDKDGIVYDEFGNPVGDITPGQQVKPGTDFSGTLNNDGTITKPDGSVIDYNGNIVKPPPTPDKPIVPGPGIISPIVTAPELNKPPATTTGSYTLNWGTPPTINLPGVNPGIYAQAVRPYYQGTEIQPQYYWGKHPYARTEADLANYNVIPEAPAQPFGAQFSAVGGNRRMDVNQFIQNYMNPEYQAGYLGSQPQYAGIQGTRSPIQAAPAGPVPPSAIPQPVVQQAAPVFAAPGQMNVQTKIGTLPPVSIPTWTKEGGLYYAMPTAAAV